MTQVIYPTNHAIERFEERILPLIPKTNPMRPNDKQIIKKRLFRLTKMNVKIDEELESMKHDILEINVFFTPVGGEKSPPIPITLVINRNKRILLTIYITSNWSCDDEKNPKVWRLTV
tara:strand:- start:1784 stop:2137 length:354 start_codon:yes stop_codon:yes gene_type:complete